MRINLNLRPNEMDLMRKFWRYRFDIVNRGDGTLTLHGTMFDDGGAISETGRPVKKENNAMVVKLLEMKGGDTLVFPWLKDEAGVQKDRQDQLYRNIKKAEKAGLLFSVSPLQIGLSIKCDGMMAKAGT